MLMGQELVALTLGYLEISREVQQSVLIPSRSRSAFFSRPGWSGATIHLQELERELWAAYGVPTHCSTEKHSDFFYPTGGVPCDPDFLSVKSHQGELLLTCPDSLWHLLLLLMSKLLTRTLCTGIFVKMAFIRATLFTSTLQLISGCGSYLRHLGWENYHFLNPVSQW